MLTWGGTYLLEMSSWIALMSNRSSNQRYTLAWPASRFPKKSSIFKRKVQFWYKKCANPSNPIPHHRFRRWRLPSKGARSMNLPTTVNVEEFSVHRVPPMPCIQNRKSINRPRTQCIPGDWAIAGAFAVVGCKIHNRAQSLCTPGFSVFWAASNKVDNFPSILSPPGTTTHSLNQRSAHACLPQQRHSSPAPLTWEASDSRKQLAYLPRHFQDFGNRRNPGRVAGKVPDSGRSLRLPCLIAVPVLVDEIQEWPTAIPGFQLLKVPVWRYKCVGDVPTCSRRSRRRHAPTLGEDDPDLEGSKRLRSTGTWPHVPSHGPLHSSSWPSSQDTLLQLH